MAEQQNESRAPRRCTQRTVLLGFVIYLLSMSFCQQAAIMLCRDMTYSSLVTSFSSSLQWVRGELVHKGSHTVPGTAEFWSSFSHCPDSLSQLSHGPQSFLTAIRVPVISGPFANLKSLICLVPALETRQSGTLARHRERNGKKNQTETTQGWKC